MPYTLIDGSLAWEPEPPAPPDGPVDAPALPASTVALVSPFRQGATVYITGGTVTAVEIDDEATGLTEGSFRLPPGQTIAVTYSVAPTWEWFLG